MVDVDLRGLERRARASRDLNDVLAYCAALERLGPDALQGLLGTGRDSWQNLMYRHALKVVGRGSAGLDLRLPHRYSVVGSGNLNYGATRVKLVSECRDDNGLHPFFDKDPRPLTFKETIQARMDQFDQSSGKDWSLWRTWLDSCTGIVWEAGGRRFKIVPMHGDLLTTQPSNAEYLPANFANTPGEPLVVDRNYARDLTFDEVIVHPGWLAALEGDASLLRRYAQTAFARFGRPRGMRFWAVRGGLPDHLRPLAVSNLVDDSLCDGDRDMYRGSCFARVRSL